MFRLLIIGKDALTWGQSFISHSPTLVIDTARLPAAGVRQFHDTPPDALIILASGHPGRTLSLLRTIRGCPLGEWVPVVIIYDFETSDESKEMISEKFAELSVNHVISTETDPKEIIGYLEEELGFNPGETMEQQSVVTLQAVERNRQPFESIEEFGETSRYFSRQGDTLSSSEPFRRDATRVVGTRNPTFPHEFDDEEATSQLTLPSRLATSPTHKSDSSTTAPNQAVTPLSPPQPTRIETSAYIIEQIVDPSDEFSPQETRVAVSCPKGPPPLRRTGHPTSPAIVAMQGPVNAHAIRDMLQCVRKQPYHDILGLTVEEVRRGGELVAQAHLFLHRRFDPRHVDIKYSRDYLDELNEIRDAVDDAYAVLNNQTLREEYFLALSL